LEKKGKKVHLTKEPTSYLIGGLIKSQLTHDWKSSPECLQLLFCADRAHHLEKEIIPLLKKGIFVISDRYFFSTIAYGNLEIEDWEWLKKINEKFLLPDLTFFLKVSPKVCLERIKESRFEVTLFEKEKILEKVWQNYERLAKEFKNIFIIDGERTINEVFLEIRKIIDEKL
jgi:dTMP kinase